VTTAQLFQTLFGVLGGSALGAGITGWFSRKKTKAEAEFTLTEASTNSSRTIMSILQTELMNTKTELRQAKQDFHESTEMTNNRMRLLERAMWEHRKWDVMVIKLLQAKGVDDIDPPPDLWL